MKFLSGLQPLALLILRWALSLIFIYHGYPKLVHPTDAMRDFFTSHGFPGYFLSLAGILESFGALLLFLGLFTRPTALLLAGVRLGISPFTGGRLRGPRNDWSRRVLRRPCGTR